MHMERECWTRPPVRPKAISDSEGKGTQGPSGRRQQIMGIANTKRRGEERAHHSAAGQKPSWLRKARMARSSSTGGSGTASPFASSSSGPRGPWSSSWGGKGEGGTEGPGEGPLALVQHRHPRLHRRPHRLSQSLLISSQREGVDRRRTRTPASASWPRKAASRRGRGERAAGAGMGWAPVRRTGTPPPKKSASSDATLPDLPPCKAT